MTLSDKMLCLLRTPSFVWCMYIIYKYVHSFFSHGCIFVNLAELFKKLPDYFHVMQGIVNIHSWNWSLICTRSIIEDVPSVWMSLRFDGNILISSCMLSLTLTFILSYYYPVLWLYVQYSDYISHTCLTNLGIYCKSS